MCLPTAQGHPDDVATVVTAVAEQSAERDVNHPRVDGQRPPQLLQVRFRTRRVDVLLPGHRTIGQAQRVEHVVVTLQERDDVHAARGRVRGGRARDSGDR